MSEHINVLLPEEEVDARIQAMGEQISRDYAGKQVHLICVLKGGSFFMCELAKRITVPVSLDFMSVSSYGGGTESKGVVKIVKDLDESIRDKDVLVVEDIVDSGRTLSYLLEMLRSRGPKSLRLCTLLDKPDRWWTWTWTIQDFRFRTSSWWAMVWTMTRDTATFLTSVSWNSTRHRDTRMNRRLAS